MANQDLFHANASDLDSAGADFLNCASSIQDTLTRMRNDVNNLNASFQGAAASAFYAQMDTLLHQMQTVSDQVNEMGNDLKTTAQRVRDLQAAAQTDLGSFSV